jgi:hypothetical protein
VSHQAKIDLVLAGRDRMLDDDTVSQPVAELNDAAVGRGLGLFRRVWNDRVGAPVGVGRTGPAIRFEVIRAHLAAGKIAMDRQKVPLPRDRQRFGVLGLYRSRQAGRNDKNKGYRQQITLTFEI